MRKGSVALFGACLALPLIIGAGAAGAAQPDGGRYVYVPSGAMVVFLPLPAATVSPRQALATFGDFPVTRMIAEQDAMMRHMMADMDSLMASLPDPQQMIRSVMNGMPQAVPGSGVVMTSLSSGNGTCSETITYGYPANGGQPRVHVSRTGNACGALMSTGPVGVTQTTPSLRQTLPEPVARPHERLWTVGYPPHPITTGTPPRS
ncbi:MAG TPA: hypothetical protein VNW90_31350 [Acetobacteraceae bacterium]|jgi:hypothetical protein|nr:hypothetical protein [Acetobacteraceae bacterium]